MRFAIVCTFTVCFALATAQVEDKCTEIRCPKGLQCTKETGKCDPTSGPSPTTFTSPTVPNNQTTAGVIAKTTSTPIITTHVTIPTAPADKCLALVRCPKGLTCNSATGRCESSVTVSVTPSTAPPTKPNPVANQTTAKPITKTTTVPVIITTQVTVPTAPADKCVSLVRCPKGLTCNPTTGRCEAGSITSPNPTTPTTKPTTTPTPTTTPVTTATPTTTPITTPTPTTTPITTPTPTTTPVTTPTPTTTPVTTPTPTTTQVTTPTPTTTQVTTPKPITTLEPITHDTCEMTGCVEGKICNRYTGLCEVTTTTSTTPSTITTTLIADTCVHLGCNNGYKCNEVTGRCEAVTTTTSTTPSTSTTTTTPLVIVDTCVQLGCNDGYTCNEESGNCEIASTSRPIITTKPPTSPVTVEKCSPYEPLCSEGYICNFKAGVCEWYAKTCDELQCHPDEYCAMQYTHCDPGDCEHRPLCLKIDPRAPITCRNHICSKELMCLNCVGCGNLPVCVDPIPING